MRLTSFILVFFCATCPAYADTTPAATAPAPATTDATLAAAVAPAKPPLRKAEPLFQYTDDQGVQWTKIKSQVPSQYMATRTSKVTRATRKFVVGWVTPVLELLGGIRVVLGK